MWGGLICISFCSLNMYVWTMYGMTRYGAIVVVVESFWKVLRYRRFLYIPMYLVIVKYFLV